MRSRTLGRLGRMLFIGAALVAAAGFVSLQPAYAGAALTITKPELAAPIQEAQTAAARNDYAAAIAAMRRAEGIAGISAAERTFIHQSILAYYTQAKQYQQALTTVEAMIAANEGNRNENLRTALQLSLNLNNTAKAQQYASQLGETGNMALYLAQSQFQTGNYRGCIQTATPLLQQGRPSRDLLNLLQACYDRAGDAAGRRRILEQLVLNYPSADAWGNLITLTRQSQSGLTDEHQMELLRLRLLTGNIKTAAEYSEMAQLALLVGYPGEAKMVYEAAAKANMLEGERSTRLLGLINQRIADDRPAMSALTQQAPAEPTGMADLKLGRSLVNYGMNAEAETALRRAIQKNRLGADLEAAKVALGRALLAQDKTQPAINAFNSVAQNSSYSGISRLWSIHARQ